MAKAAVSQFSFNRGEIEAGLHGRSDWKYYASAAEKIRNMVVRPQGGAIKRSGLRFVVEALNQERPSIFIPFIFSVKQSYMLEFGDYQMRIIMNGGLVVYPEGHAKAGQVVVVQTPYSSDDMQLLRYAQTADIMYMTIASHRPRILRRYDHWDWRFEDMVFGVSVNPPGGLKITVDGKNGAQYCVTTIKETEQSSPSDVVTCTTATGKTIPVPNYSSLSIEQCYYLWVTSYGQTWPSNWNIWTMSTNQIVMSYLFGVLGFSAPTLVSNNNGTYYETWAPNYGGKVMYLTSDHTSWFNIAISYTNMGYGGVLNSMRSKIQTYVTNYNNNATATGNTTLAWNAVSGATSYYVFRSVKTTSGTKFYYIGSTTGTTFNDNNLAYDSSRGLPTAKNPFDGPDNYPGVCAFFEQRMVFARTDNQPNTFWGSVTGDYNNFTYHTPIEEADSYEFTLDSGEMNEILWIAPLNEMLFGTSGAEWKAGGGSAAISPLNVNARVQSWYGCAPMNPIKVGRTIVFVTRSRQSIRTFSYSLEADGYAGRDITEYAGHLFAGKQIVSMAYQWDQMGILWVVMSDGTLLSCAYSPEEDVIAWARHDTQGRFESVGVLRDEDGTDQIYFSVARDDPNGQTHRFIESLENIITESAAIEDMFFVDSGLSYAGEPTSSVSGMDHLEGFKVVALAGGNVIDNLTVTGGKVTLPGKQKFSLIHVGLPYQAEVQTLELEPAEGGTLRNRRRWTVNASIRFWRSRQCLFAVNDSQKRQTMKFRTERYDMPIQPFTGEKSASFYSTGNADQARVYLTCVDPVPFGVLGIIGEVSYGQAT